MNTMTSNDFVMMPVPTRFVPLVTKTLSDAYAAESALTVAPVPVQPSETASPSDRPWTAEELARLRHKVSHYAAVIAALDLTSEAPGEPILFEKIRERSGLAKGESAAQLGALTKLVKKQEFAHSNWPFSYEYNNKAGRGLYRMTADVAAAWKAVRGK